MSFDLGQGTQLEDSISFRIAGEANYSQSLRKCLLKPAAIF
jgi:hypothetical protein